MSEQQSTGDETEEEVSSSRSNKERSLVWSCFHRFRLRGDRMAGCYACGKIYDADPNLGTSKMKRHMPKCFIIDENGPPQKRVPLDQAMYEEKLAVAIIKHNYPFSYVEHKETIDLHTFLHRDVKPISRNTAKANILKIYEREKTSLKMKLEKLSGRICLTSDLWTSITTDGYMALTAHFVDESWVLRKKVLNFRFIPPPHSGSLLAGYLINFLADWGIEKKIFTVTLDNAKYNDGLVESLTQHLRVNEALVCDGDFIHVRCGARVLDLIVQAGLKAIERAIEKIRESVKYVRGTRARKFKFAEIIQLRSLQCGRQVCQDVPTRWSSTYLMLDCAIAYRNAYDGLAFVDPSYDTCPSDEEWERVRVITNFLKPFYEITTLFSGSSYPTSNLYFHKVWKIQCNIEKGIKNSDPIISKMAQDMKTKFDKFWENYCMVLSFAVIMDPRYKVKIIEYCFSKLDMDEEVRVAKVHDIVDALYKLYDDYEIHSDKVNNSSMAESSNVGTGNSLDGDGLDGFESFESQYERRDTSGKSQLKIYLEEPGINRKRKIDVLHFWRDNQDRLPQLAHMARDILSIPIFTVASESSFSIGGRIISKYQSSQSSSNAEALLCTRDWLFDVEDEDEEEGLAEDIEALIPSLRRSNDPVIQIAQLVGWKRRLPK